MKKIMTLLIAMVAMFGLNSCEVFNEEKDSPWIEFGFDTGEKDLSINIVSGFMNSELYDALDQAIKAENFERTNAGKYISHVAYTNSEAKSVVNRIVKKVNIEQYPTPTSTNDFVVRWRMSSDNTYKEVYRKNFYKK